MNPVWDFATFDYRIAPKQTRKVKLLGWLSEYGSLMLLTEDSRVSTVGCLGEI